MTDRAANTPEPPIGPWNPGVRSDLPSAFLPLVTVYRPEHVETPLRDALDLSDLCGLPARQLTRFRASRLVVHEVLIRVMSDLSVPVGAVYADLGVNFRAIVATILREGVEPRLEDVEAALAEIRADADAVLTREIADILDDAPVAAPPRPGWLDRLLGRRPPAVETPREDLPTRALRHLDSWQRRAAESGDGLEIAACEALRAVVSGLIARQNTLIRDPTLLRNLAGTLVSNGYGSRRVGELIEPWIAAVVEARGYRRLAAQDHPVVMNVKGASASGKSTIRPYQLGLARRLGMAWSDFAVITPDVWRKYLLDYDSLGEAARYAGTLTGYEVEIIDMKLDRYVTRRAAERRISNLLIDRFRFDSFQAEAGSDGGGQLLTRFGDRVYMQFMVTPPADTVERAWQRGEMFGRYKAVEDLLAHNVEAYTGMPRLFFNWVLARDKQVVCEFLDNSVPLGERPRTIAFWANGILNILDVKGLIDIDRFRKVDIFARAPDAVFKGADLSASANTTFLNACLRRMAAIRFVQAETGRAILRLDRGRITGLDRIALAALAEGPDWDAARALLGIPTDTASVPELDETLNPADEPTLGAWGPFPGIPQTA
ncbi:zeta toxin family protein [Methylobacterium sp. J-030]|uniref:zeta toxin family protein n=1 Tax=Methylobacterium sp. J-030 TaxID=2836627 RepID=UPI001FB89B90|nr:zeta toxin family protein [Methylobacterium sp. J-030]MCJ2071464.1 zeta toxin family protein [Methylobacterium sp. J-030]